MQQVFEDYFKSLFKRMKIADHTEETFYSNLESFFKECAKLKGKTVSVTPRPKKTEAGNPDFRVWNGRGEIIGYIEAKPSKTNLDSIENSEQLKRYRETFPNLILTNFFEFRLYKNGELVGKPIQIGRPFVIHTLKTVPPVENKEEFLELLSKFLAFSTPRIYTSKALAIQLAKLTRFLRDQVIIEELAEEEKREKGNLLSTYKVFKKFLISSLDQQQFANLYAQTITYGLFASRTRADGQFSRELAYKYIPKTIGILRDVFKFISLGEIPTSMEWIVNDIAEILAKADVAKIMEDFYKEGKGRDPIIHFYETFLAEYDPTEREKRGVYYTPEPVVSYIVKSLQHLLKKEFGKEDGFATSSVTVLDPASGTLTFPVKAIHEAIEEYKKKYGSGGIKGLIKEHILKNFYAFELMMAPYAVGHLKMSFIFDEFDYQLAENERFKLYLTNTLEAKDLQQSELPYLTSLSEESRLAGKVKREIPILVILGNPPYSVSSDNKSIFIEGGRVPEKINKNKKVTKYRYVPGLMDLYKEDVRDERNIQPLSDDYIKFIRFAHWKIEQAGKGLIGYITNNSYLSGLIHRGMRKKLAESFDEIYILNLHGNSLIGETTPNGSKDENVFDIRQGVAIALFVKTGKKKNKLAKVFYKDLYGLRGDIDRKGTKYHYLWNNSIKTSKWQKLDLRDPHYFFVPKDFKSEAIYNTFLSLKEIFSKTSTGVKTHRDKFILGNSAEELKRKLLMFRDKQYTDQMLKDTFNLKDTGTWEVSKKRSDFIKQEIDEDLFKLYAYRPFDTKWTYYSKLLIERSRDNFIWNINPKHLALVTTRQLSIIPFNHAFITENPADICLISLQTKESAYIFPLFISEGKEVDLNPKTQQSLLPSDQMVLKAGGKRVNFKQDFLDKIDKNLISADPAKRKISYEDIFYYIYAILYSNAYRQKYEEFLKIGFPKIPFTKDYQLFQKLVKLGKDLVDLHLLKSSKLNNPSVKFEGKGDNVVKFRKYVENKQIVEINESKSFGPIPKEVWDYQIGGYQVLDKWLKDRKKRALTSDEIKHYCKVVTAIKETIDLQKEIDKLYPRVEKNLI